MQSEDLVRMGWNTLRDATLTETIAGSSEARVLKGECFVKLGKRSVIEPEARVYRRLRAGLGSAAGKGLPLGSPPVLSGPEEGGFFF